MTRVYIDGFEHGPGGHCSSTAMRDLLKFYGHGFTEDMVFGLGVGVGFVYFSHPGMKPPVYIGGRIYNLEEHVCSSLGIGIEVVSGLGDDEAWLAAKEMIDAGSPVMVHADVYFLDYLRALVHFSGHRIVLVGYDEEKGVAFVADNDRDTVQECTLASLRKARSSAYLPQPADNTLYRFDLPERLIPLDEAIPPALDKAVRYNLRLEPEHASFTFDGARVIRGMVGLERFSEEMAGWPDLMEPETLSLLCKSIYVTAEKGGTGYGGNFRRIYGRFLLEAAGVLDEPRLAGLGDEFVGIGDTWTEMCMIFKELSAEGREAVARAVPVAGKIYRSEMSAFTELESVAAALGEGE